MSEHRNEQGDDDASTTSNTSAVSADGFFYWQRPPALLAACVASNSILEEEGYLAIDINWGRALLDQPIALESVPPVSRDWPGPPSTEHVSDAVSAILQAAVEAGMDPDLICEQALRTHRAVRRFAVQAAYTRTRREC